MSGLTFQHSLLFMFAHRAAIGIVVLERFIELSATYLNQHVFAALDLEQAMLRVYSEREGHLTEISKIRFPYSV